MKRPVTLLFLLVFAAVQIYFAKVPLSHQVQGSSWIEVSPEAGGMVEREGQYYLVTPTSTYRLTANQVHITANKKPMRWVDVPEPSGAGVWKLAVGPGALPLVGIGGPVYPSPDGRSIIWVDSTTHIGYVSLTGAPGMQPLSRKMGRLNQVLWAPDSQAVGLVGVGPQGEGAYVWDRDGNVSAVALPSAGLTITGLGFSQNNQLLAKLNDGRVLMQGRGIIALPAMSPLFLAKDHADILGETANQVIFWRNGTKLGIDRPDLKWIGRPAFSVDGQAAAILSKGMGDEWRLLTYGNHEHLEISLPYPHTTYHLLGFLGSHWIVITVPSGPHTGTYAWWIQG